MIVSPSLFVKYRSFAIQFQKIQLTAEEKGIGLRKER
jgi:hypothetical protein